MTVSNYNHIAEGSTKIFFKLSERGARLTDEQKKRQLPLEQASNTKQTP